ACRSDYLAFAPCSCWSASPISSWTAPGWQKRSTRPRPCLPPPKRRPRRGPIRSPISVLSLPPIPVQLPVPARANSLPEWCAGERDGAAGRGGGNPSGAFAQRLFRTLPWGPALGGGAGLVGKSRAAAGREVVGLFPSLPILWREAHALSDLLASDAPPHWALA